MRVMPLLAGLTMVATLAACSDDGPQTATPQAAGPETSSPTAGSTLALEAPDPTDSPASSPMTIFSESEAASVSGCLTHSKDGYSYAYSLDVHTGEARYRIRMPHKDAWDDWSTWLGPLSFSTKSGASFGTDPESPAGVVRAQVETKEGERATYESPLGRLDPC